jgi:hypothetical protein
MKKLFLLATAALVGFGANAQNALPIGGGLKQAIPTHQIANGPTGVLGKSTAGGSRWYDHMATVDIFNGGVMSTSLMPIWFDSTVMQNFTTGLSNINFISAAQIIDPIYYTLFNDPNIFSPTDIRVSPSDAYQVDSVSVSCAYVKNLNRSANIVDTLILSVSPSTYSYYWATAASGDPDDAWVNSYVPNAGDTIRGFTILNVDSINRASLNPGVVMWKVPMGDAMRQEDSAGFVDIQTFDFPVMVNGNPGVVDIPANRGIAITVTFKSGDVVPVPNVDTFSEYHNFSLFEGEALGDGQLMPYYYYTQSDRNMSNLMFSTDTTRYIPSVFIEGWNTADFRQEFHAIAAHVVCATCNPLDVASTKSNVSQVVAYPNPANNEVNIAFTTAQSGKVNVSVTNAVGQVMSNQTINAVAGQNNKTAVSTANMASGVYFYTIEANGQRTTNRFVVSH